MLPIPGQNGLFDFSLDPNNPMANVAFAAPVPTVQPVAGAPVPPVGPTGPALVGQTPPVPGLFSGIGDWFSGQDMAGQGPYEPADYHRARANLLMGLGANLLAAGQPMSGAQRAQIIQGMPQVAGQYREDLKGGLQDRLTAQQLAEQKQFSEYSSNPENLRALGWNDNQIALVNKLPRAERTQVVEKALTEQFSNQNGGIYGTPIYGERNGQSVLLALPKSGGGAVEQKLPPGVELSKGYETINTPTEAIVMDKITGQVIARYPKDVAGAAYQTQVGEAGGKAAAGLEGATFQAERMRQTINSILSPKRSDALEMATGGSAAIVTPWTAPEAYDMQADIKSLKSQTFAQGIEQMRGLGALSDAEGRAVTEAIANLDLYQGTPHFIDVLKGIQQTVAKGLAVLQKRAQQPAPPGTQTQPQTSDPLSLRK